ncbi:FAD-dependent oxidoreductase [Halorubellus sp. PRR65]|uniref:FAD-dependent oxidoreductase n=1 Tax=Halorubellus sp. PRR65 TaxID=3098148 RepID=UPI002B25FB74|nr:FAD-dependent oxidoreductase [Halorubellus sp. PRR65]
MNGSPTVLVVGGGATGTGAARDLANRGVDVALVDRGGLGSGTSGRSHGLLHSGARYAESDPVGAEECIEENRVLREIAGACVRDTGGLFVELAADDPTYFDAKRAACEDVGIPTTVLDADEARERVPGLSADVERAMAVPDGVVYPSRLVAANAAAVEAAGGSVHPHAPLDALAVEDGRVVAADLGGRVDATVEPEFVVNATGAWAGDVAAMAGVDVAMAPSRGAMLAVDHGDLGPVLNRCRDPDDGDIVLPHGDEVVLGTTSVPVDDPDEYEHADWELDRCIEECAAMLPAVADADVTRTWWGVRPLYAPDEADSDRRGISRGFFALDHADDGVANLATIVGGKLTTYRRMAEATADMVADRLGVDEPSMTASVPLPGADDPDRLDAFVDRYDARNPADANLDPAR